MSKLENKMSNLEDTVKVMSDTIKVLEEKVQSLSNESKTSFNKPFKCDYKASKNSVLKRYVTSKHKQNIPAPEI